MKCKNDNVAADARYRGLFPQRRASAQLKWPLVFADLVLVAFCLDVAVSDFRAAAFCARVRGARAIVELIIPSPLIRKAYNCVREKDIPIIRNHILAFRDVREIIVSGKVDFGEEIDPGNAAQIRRIYRQVVRKTRIRFLDSRRFSVSHSSGDPRRDVAFVNELVKRFVGEHLKDDLEQAKSASRPYVEEYNKAKARLFEIDSLLRELTEALNNDFAEQGWAATVISGAPALKRLLIEKESLEEERRATRTRLRQLRTAVRTADRELARIYTEIYGCKYRIREHARLDHPDAPAAISKEHVETVQRIALACAILLAAGGVAFLLLWRAFS